MVFIFPKVMRGVLGTGEEACRQEPSFAQEISTLGCSAEVCWHVGPVFWEVHCDKSIDTLTNRVGGEEKKRKINKVREEIKLIHNGSSMPKR